MVDLLKSVLRLIGIKWDILIKSIYFIPSVEYFLLSIFNFLSICVKQRVWKFVRYDICTQLREREVGFLVNSINSSWKVTLYRHPMRNLQRLSLISSLNVNLINTFKYVERLSLQDRSWNKVFWCVLCSLFCFRLFELRKWKFFFSFYLISI